MEESKFFISAKLEEVGSKKRDTSYVKRGGKQTVLRNTNRKKKRDIKNIGTELLRSVWFTPSSCQEPRSCSSGFRALTGQAPSVPVLCFRPLLEQGHRGRALLCTPVPAGGRGCRRDMRHSGTVARPAAPDGSRAFGRHSARPAEPGSLSGGGCAGFPSGQGSKEKPSAHATVASRHMCQTR